MIRRTRPHPPRVCRPHRAERPIQRLPPDDSEASPRRPRRAAPSPRRDRRGDSDPGICRGDRPSGRRPFREQDRDDRRSLRPVALRLAIQGKHISRLCQAPKPPAPRNTATAWASVSACSRASGQAGRQPDPGPGRGDPPGREEPGDLDHGRPLGAVVAQKRAWRSEPRPDESLSPPITILDLHARFFRHLRLYRNTAVRPATDALLCWRPTEGSRMGAPPPEDVELIPELPLWNEGSGSP